MPADVATTDWTPEPVIDKDGQVTIKKEDFERIVKEHKEWGSDAKKYAQESGNRRVELKTFKEEVTPKLEKLASLESLVAERDKQIAEMKDSISRLPADPAAFAALNRRIAEMETKLNASETEKAKMAEERKATTYKSELTGLVGKLAEAGLETVTPEIGFLYLREHTRLGADGKLELRASDEDGAEKWINATVENVTKAKLLRPEYLKSKGAPGSGQQPPVIGAGGEVLDMERAKRDPEYYNKHRTAILAVLAAKSQGR